jgi:hypothetical protein
MDGRARPRDGSPITEGVDFAAEARSKDGFATGPLQFYGPAVPLSATGGTAGTFPTSSPGTAP